MNQPLALIVDDEPDIRELLEITLHRMGVMSHPAGSLTEARNQLAHRRFDLCLTDLKLPDGDGIDLVRIIAARYPELPVAVFTAHGNMDSAVEALKAGAFDFVSKPVDLQVLRKLVTAALRLGSPTDLPPPTPDEPSAHWARRQLLGASPAMQHLRTLIAKVARSQAPVFISGESGTGKELVARLIHEQGPRVRGPFIAVNCGAIPQELMESELFGHKKGSFTGAVTDKEGLFQAAAGGTLFFDEVADLPLPMQVKLLRAVQERAVRPVGALREQAVDVRILSATHKNLAAAVAAESFRQDLYYRINVIELPIPPLRQRPQDIPELVQHILTRHAADYRLPIPSLSPAALAALSRYPFPGNVRELENILERAMTLAGGNVLEAADLCLPGAPPQAPSTASEPQPAATDLTGDLTDNLEAYLEQVERRMILQALETTDWNRTEAARRLGISFRALRYRLAKLGLDKAAPED